MIDLRKIAIELKFNYNVACEVGVYAPMSAHIMNLVPHCGKVIMIEALPENTKKINDYYKKYDYVKIYNVAITEENVETVKLYRRNEATFLEGIQSPEVQIFNYKPDESTSFFVEGKTFDNYDDGDIDILAVDIEGAEWFVIRKLKSRPKIICLETHYQPPRYINPYMKEILGWMDENNYIKYIEDVSDTVYVKK